MSQKGDGDTSVILSIYIDRTILDPIAPWQDMFDDWFSMLAHLFCSCFMVLLCGLKGSIPAVFGSFVVGPLLDLGSVWLGPYWIWVLGDWIPAACGP